MIAAAHRPPFVLALLVALVGLVALAYASPTDPTWLAGVYDDADHDDVVAAATSTEARLECLSLLVERTVPVIAAVVWPADPSPASSDPFPSFSIRAPPIHKASPASGARSDRPQGTSRHPPSGPAGH